MTGIRRGELLGLRWADLDVPTARLSLQRARVVAGYRVIESTPKSHIGRVLDLDTATVDALQIHRLRQDAERREWGQDYEDDDLIAAWENGSAIHPQSFSGMFRRLVLKAGVRPISFHGLRHTHATLALHAGAPVNVVSERLGHRSPAFTLKQYAHVLPGMQADAAAAVSELVAREQLSHEPPRSLSGPRPPQHEAARSVFATET
jgi:integrase